MQATMTFSAAFSAGVSGWGMGETDRLKRNLTKTIHHFAPNRHDISQLG
jgi:hypothetical protein